MGNNERRGHMTSDDFQTDMAVEQARVGWHGDDTLVALYIRFSWVVVLPGSMGVLSQFGVFCPTPQEWPVLCIGHSNPEKPPYKPRRF